MRKGDLMNKAFAAAVTIGFLAAVRPDAEPERWSVALIAVLMYEAIRWSMEYIQKVNRRRKQKRYISLNLKARNEDGKRWADEWIMWPIREVN